MSDMEQEQIRPEVTPSHGMESVTDADKPEYDPVT